jgi:hypothetical protein
VLHDANTSFKSRDLQHHSHWPTSPCVADALDTLAHLSQPANQKGFGNCFPTICHSRSTPFNVQLLHVKFSSWTSDAPVKALQGYLQHCLPYFAPNESLPDLHSSPPNACSLEARKTAIVIQSFECNRFCEANRRKFGVLNIHSNISTVPICYPFGRRLGVNLFLRLEVLERRGTVFAESVYIKVDRIVKLQVVVVCLQH